MNKTLNEYNRKREFKLTAEPKGTVGSEHPGRLRFVVQHHIASRDHYDFRLEWKGALKSWAVPKGPSYSSKDRRLAVQVEDHPLDYRNFEGTIPKGQYGGGVVMIWDQGFWQPQGDPEQGLKDGSLKFTLEGVRLKGNWALVRMKPKPGEKDNNWLLIKEKDEYENALDIRQLTTSVQTGRSMAAIEENSKGESDMSDTVTITSPDKELFPGEGITKNDVASYYLKIADRMMPYVENRILSAVRCPEGIEGSCFFRKHPAKSGEGVAITPVAGSDGQTEDYFYLTSAYGLLTEVQMNTIEFHTWGSRVETLEKPDMMVFDLDPDEGMDLADIRRGVRDLKSLLEELSLVSYLKTSGGKGYHIVLPFQPQTGWQVFHDFAQNIAKTMEVKWPERYTSNVRKDSRKGKIFVDWIRNGRGATSVAPYSLRARKGAPVSMPIKWNELDKVAPADIKMEDAIKRLRRKDPWEGFFEQDQKLK